MCSGRKKIGLALDSGRRLKQVVRNDEIHRFGERDEMGSRVSTGRKKEIIKKPSPLSVEMGRTFNRPSVHEHWQIGQTYNGGAII